MILVVAFQALYVADAVAAEESILTTIDIVTVRACVRACVRAWFERVGMHVLRDSNACKCDNI